MAQLAISHADAKRGHVAEPLRVRKGRLALVVAAMSIVAGSLLSWRLLSSTPANHATVQIPSMSTIKLDGITFTAASPRSIHRLTSQQALNIVQEQFNDGPLVFLSPCQPSRVVTGCEDRPLEHVRAIAATFIGDVGQLRDVCGGVFNFSPKASAWFVRLSIPPQDGYTAIQGAYVVNDSTENITGGFFAATDLNTVVC
jgi:hypothetical protein